jgi:hypothetical protein
MNDSPDDIVQREFRHGKTAYNFRWNRTNHKKLGHTEGDLASLWAHLSLIQSGKIPEQTFMSPFYSRASSLKLSTKSDAAQVRLRRKLMKTGNLKRSLDNDLVSKIREYHRYRNATNYMMDHSIIQDFLMIDPLSIAIEIPVWSEKYQITGHIDLLRCANGKIQVCDYKPGTQTTTTRRFLRALPQVAAYGELLAHHLSNTLRPALNAPLLPNVECCIFDAHSCWTFGAELFVTLHASGNISNI